MLDEKKLPPEPTIYKAHWHSPEWGMNFGTLYVRPKNGIGTGSALENYFSKIVESIMDKAKCLILPDGWNTETIWYSDDFNAASYVSVFFVLPWKIQSIEHGGSIPTDVAHLLSGYFQLGENFNFRNFQNYRFLKNLKFLPFLITRGGLRVHVFHPTQEHMEAVVERLIGLERFFKDLRPQLTPILKDIYALIRLDEISTSSDSVGSAYREVEARLNGIIGQHKDSLGYLFKDLKGPQNSRLFYYEMFGSSEK
ncbi:MAG TPA: hypothetical protein PKZ16_00575 [bacterium]|nr:hypothetical protein [bacterium]HPL95728.1 hypothetical protein [bacterium]